MTSYMATRNFAKFRSLVATALLGNGTPLMKGAAVGNVYRRWRLT
jgi:hypothetical protein